MKSVNRGVNSSCMVGENKLEWHIKLKCVQRKLDIAGIAIEMHLLFLMLLTLVDQASFSNPSSSI